MARAYPLCHRSKAYPLHMKYWYLFVGPLRFFHREQNLFHLGKITSRLA